MPDNRGGVDTSMYSNQIKPIDPLGTMQQVNNIKLQQNAIDTGQFELINKQMGNLRSTLSALVANPNVSSKDVIDATGKLVSVGALKPQQAAVELANMPQDPAQLRGWLTNHLATTSANHQQFQNIMGTPVERNDGQTRRYDIVNPLNRQVTPMQGGVMTNRLTPGEAAQPIQGEPTPEGAPTVMPLGRFAERGGMAPRGTYSQQPQAPQQNNLMPQQPAQAPQGANRLVPQQQQPAQPPMAPQAQNLPQGGNMAVGLPPGKAQAQTLAAEQSAQQGGALQKSADGALARKGMLANLEDDLKHFESGPMAASLNKAKAGVNQVAGIAGMNAPFNPETVASQEKFVKQSTQLAQQQFAALGGTGTDNQLGSALKSNPSEYLSKQGNKQIISMLKGNEDALAAMNTEWQKWKKNNGADTYGQFQQEFNKAFEPRAFQFVHLEPKDRVELLKSMTPNERSNVLRAIDNAEKNGWIESKDVNGK